MAGLGPGACTILFSLYPSPEPPPPPPHCRRYTQQYPCCAGRRAAAVIVLNHARRKEEEIRRRRGGGNYISSHGGGFLSSVSPPSSSLLPPSPNCNRVATLFRHSIESPSFPAALATREGDRPSGRKEGSTCTCTLFLHAPISHGRSYPTRIT